MSSVCLPRDHARLSANERERERKRTHEKSTWGNKLNLSLDKEEQQMDQCWINIIASHQSPTDWDSNKEQCVRLIARHLLGDEDFISLSLSISKHTRKDETTNKQRDRPTFFEHFLLSWAILLGQWFVHLVMFGSTQRRQLRGIRRWCNHACSRHHSNQREGIYYCCCGCLDGRSSPLSLSLPLRVCIEWWQPLEFSLLVYTHDDDVTLGYFLYSLSSHLPLCSLLACCCSDLTTNACRGSIFFLSLLILPISHTHTRTDAYEQRWMNSRTPWETNRRILFFFFFFFV